MKFDPEKPFNELPLLPPQADLLSQEVLLKLVAAGRELAELKGMGKTIPDQNILMNSLILQEAKNSSEIENVVTTHDARIEPLRQKPQKSTPRPKTVLHYREALWLDTEPLKKDGLLQPAVSFSWRRL
jgi:Fic family protein